MILEVGISEIEHLIRAEQDSMFALAGSTIEAIVFHYRLAKDILKNPCGPSADKTANFNSILNNGRCRSGYRPGKGRR